MVTKSDRVREHVKSGDYKQALKIAKTFKLGLTPNQQDIIKRAYECFMYPGFYKQINIDPDQAYTAGITVLKQIYS